ncbi:putative arylamine n-acetyltransferase 1 protein [Neofusicoccum parvum]|uniref:Arylamine n-acetyltransferase 1 protein n=3 Tax=Neofusicoccum TaxID=407951 RepID=A0ACB5RQ43_9PEZI|nr:putative tpa: arylamine n-acetyltransferase 1 protein [Neofusicoccum parvum UCRNP2]GME22619.1 putative arylamine n-acetyltransferase 1 protein [Neofusicoccum parvum]GME47101.1 putative arylamine n-acetyltransferase 1 protein [Neofusicoccum parvum]
MKSALKRYDSGKNIPSRPSSYGWTMADAPRYTKAQLRQYFDRICLPDNLREYDVTVLSPQEKLDYLAMLQKQSLSTIPFENLSLHYSQHRRISLDPDELFRKQVKTQGRGGYCMENNLVHNIVLRSLGYTIYSAGARVKGGPDAPFDGWSHMVNLVTIGTHKYLVDVGFGPNGPTHPLRLERNACDTTSTQISPAEMRLAWKNIDGNTDLNQRLWVYQHRTNNELPWLDMYCFAELEFMPQDYEIMNYHTSTNSKAWFTQKVMCAKMVIDSPENSELVGAMILQTDLKLRIHGKTESQQMFKNEEDRIAALDRVFGIVLSKTERAGIKGLVSEIK